MNFAWYPSVLKRYAQFEGRASRSEYWNFALFNLVVSIAIGIVGGMVGLDIIGMVYSLAVLVPGIAVAIRRMHDIGKSGLYILFALIPCVGIFILIYFLVQPSQDGGNEFGDAAPANPPA